VGGLSRITLGNQGPKKRLGGSGRRGYPAQNQGQKIFTKGRGSKRRWGGKLGKKRGVQKGAFSIGATSGGGEEVVEKGRVVPGRDFSTTKRKVGKEVPHIMSNRGHKGTKGKRGVKVKTIAAEARKKT